MAAPALAVAAAPKGVTSDDTLADDGPTFLAWEADRATAYREHAAAEREGPDEARAWTGALDAERRILTTPCRSRTAAVVKLRTVLDPDVGLFSCGEGKHDETALKQVLAFMGDHRGEWGEAGRGQPFSVALAGWRAADHQYGEVASRWDVEGVREHPEIDAAWEEAGRALKAMIATPTPSRAALADKLQVLAERDGVDAFIAALRRGEG